MKSGNTIFAHFSIVTFMCIQMFLHLNMATTLVSPTFLNIELKLRKTVFRNQFLNYGKKLTVCPSCFNRLQLQI